MASHSKIGSTHPVFINKKTGKVASTNNWLLALAAHAHINGHTSGLAGLLPQKQGIKLLVHNKLVTKVPRGASLGRLTDEISSQARTLLPALAVMFAEQHPKHKTMTRKNFCIWLIKHLADENSSAYRQALLMGCEALLSKTTDKTPRGVRWWLDQIKKMQS